MDIRLRQAASSDVMWINFDLADWLFFIGLALMVGVLDDAIDIAKFFVYFLNFQV